MPERPCPRHRRLPRTHPTNRADGTNATHSATARSVAVLGLALALGPAALAPAAAALITNGSFEQIAGAPVRVTDNLPGWSTGSGYTFVSADRLLGEASGDIFGIGSTVHLIAATASPDGGNFLATDTDYYNFGPLRTQLQGLVVGQSYALSFWQAMGKQDMLSDGTAVGGHWMVSLDGRLLGHSALVQATPDNGYFSGWMLQTLRFDATAPTEWLSFMALGAGTGLPPFVLLDGVRVAAIPLPDSLALAALALLLLGVTAAARRPRPLRHVGPRAARQTRRAGPLQCGPR